MATEDKELLTLNNNGICRMCLSTDFKDMCLINKFPVILKEIETCFSIRSSTDDPFPNQICKVCFDKIVDLHKYRLKVTTYDRLLLYNANKGLKDLNRFYTVLKNPEYLIKDERHDFSKNYSSSKRTDTKELNSDTNIKHANESANIKSEEPMPTSEEITGHKNERSTSPICDAIEDCDSDDYYKQTKSDETIFQTEGSKTDSVETEENNTSSIQNYTKFKCLMCFEILESNSLLLLHYNTIHKPEENPVKAKYEEHETEDGTIRYNCTKCNKLLETKRSALRHLREHSNIGRPFLCKICGRTYLTASDIARHGRAHSGAKVYCSFQCGYSTAYDGALAQHEKRHNGEGKYKCEECGKSFQVKTWYFQHQNIHKGLKPFVCNICGVAFHMDRYLTAHRSSVHPQTSDLKRYVCTHCSLPCDSKKALTEHLKEHGIKSSFLCDLCGKTLSNAEQLKFHKRVHLGVRPYACGSCDKTFTKKFNLRLHERTHTGEKSFSCGECGKHYSQKSTLMRHNNRHHADFKQNKCTRCAKCFASLELLTAHEPKCI